MSPGKMSTLKPLCKYYMDALGVKRRIGKRDELKASQILDQHIVCTHAPRQDPLRRRPLETRIACRNTTSELRNYTRSFGEFLAGAFLHLRSVPLLQLYIVWVQYDIIVLLDIKPRSKEPFVPQNRLPGLGADALRKSDYELFVQECLSEPGINGLGDLWADVALFDLRIGFRLRA